MLSRLRRSNRINKKSRKRRTINIEPLEARQMLTGNPVMSEFMASNNTTLLDEDGESSDWIEIFNSGTSAVDLDGYALTDDADDANQWEFPPVELAAGGYLTVFASNKNRDDPESELHTNFRLSSGGEYLALVAPDGTVIQEFAQELTQEYPPQVPDVSYGLGTDSVITNLIDVGAAGSAIVPTDGALENDWHQPGFDDGGWTGVSTAIGYETGDSEIGLYGEFVDGLSPVAHWTFDEGSSILAGDSSPNNISGISFNTSREDSPIGRAVNLTKANDDVKVLASGTNFSKLESTDELAIAIWVQKTATNVGDVISLGDHYRVRLNPDGSVEFAYDNSSGADSWASVTTDPGIAAETVPVDDQWHHIVAQKTNTGLEIWIDGVKSSAELATTDPIDYAGLGADLIIGRNGNGSTSTDNFVGKVDDAAVWDEALSEETIVSLFGGGDTPGGYTDTISSDVQADMFGNNASVYLRIPFELTDLSSFNQLTLYMQYDDGFVAYINGTEVARGNAPGDVGMPVPFDAEAFDSRPDSDAIEFSRIDVSDGQAGLQIGENILAIQGLNVTADNPDFLLSAKLDAALVTLSTEAEGYMTNPTPGALNNTASDELGPVIGGVQHSGQPADGEPIVVTAEITQTIDPVDTVQLIYHVMFDDEVTLTMADDGAGSDVVAGDGVFTAVIPGGVANPGEMIRWYVGATDTEGEASREPRWVDPTLLDRQEQEAEYFGTMVADPTVTSDIAILHWFVENESAAGQDSGTHASLWYNGEFYDNVENHRRGGSTAGQAKTNFKFDFKGETFRFDPNFGRVEEFNLNSTFSDKAYVRQSLAFEAHDVAGAPGSESFPMHVQRNGQFYGVFAFIEEPDAAMLEREGLDPNGALYKHYNEFTGAGGSRKKTRQYENNSDLQSFISSVNSLNGAALSNYLFDNVNVPLMMNYLVSTITTHQNDNPHKNHFLYRDSDGTGEWTFIPWDHDLTWGSNWVGTSYSDVIYADQDDIRTGPVPGHNGNGFIHPSHPLVNTQGYREWNNHWNRLMDAVLDEPRMREMFLRRLRTVMDDFLGSPDENADETYFNQRLDDYLATMSADAAADKQRWPFNYGDRNQTFEQAVQIIKDEYLAVRRVHLYETHNIDNAEVSEPIEIISEFVDGVRYFVPTDNSLGDTWTGLEDPANIGDWGTGQAGLGFEDAPGDYQDLMNTNVRPADACATCTSIFLRVPFEIEDVGEVRDLILRVKYDDGFIAYVNGTEVARSAFLGSRSFDMTTPFSTVHSGLEFRDFTITDDIGLLNAGANILAIHSFNNRATDSDQFISPSLVDKPLNANIANAGIPNEQPADATLVFGEFDANPISGNQDEEYVRIDNPNDTAIDLTGWRLAGGIDHEFLPGTVIEAGGSLYVSPHVPTFRARATGPAGGQGHFVQGEYKGHLSSFGDVVHLLNRDLGVVSTLEVAPSTSAAQQYLRITELNYNPGSTGAEFLEVTNFFDGAAPLDLSGVTISQGFAQPFVFAPGTALNSGESLLIVRDQAAFTAAYPEVDSAIIAGQYVGSLDSNGERIKMDEASGSTIMDFSYGDNDPWPDRADGVGATLVLIDPVDAVPDAEGKYYSWRASTEPDGTPGSADNAEPVGVVISEVLSNSEAELDAIELHNTTNETIAIGGWYLSDAGSNLLKYQIPAGTELAAGDYAVFDESHFNPNPANPGPNDFALNGAHGDDVWLVTSDGNGAVASFVDDVHFRAAQVGESFGLDGNGRLVPMSETTLGAENASPRVGPLVISEVNYNPGFPTAAAQLVDQHVGRSDLEYVEIYNPTGSAVDLTDWRLRGGIDMNFDAGTMIAPAEALLVISFNPDSAGNSNRLAAFRQQYGLSDSTRLVGGYGGQLSDSTDVVRLMRPDTPPMDEMDFTPHTIEDEVLYDDVAPWATAADGEGHSLQRVTPTGYGNAAASWTATTPSPAVADFSNVPGDLTGDGVVTSEDIDALYSAINAGLTETRYDLDGSGTVDTDDVTYLVETILDTWFGDANLDGRVDAQDLNVIGINWRNDGTLWAGGDFTGDGSTTAADLNALALNWQNGVIQAAPAAHQRVPRAPLAAAGVNDAAIADLAGRPDESGEAGGSNRVIRHIETPLRQTENSLNPRFRQRKATGNRRLGAPSSDGHEVADEATLVDDVLAGLWGRRSLS